MRKLALATILLLGSQKVMGGHPGERNIQLA